jgi:2-desacetyl-2-hydroxyethyl bacteriochlorophyllide A dehydrogenase
LGPPRAIDYDDVKAVVVERPGEVSYLDVPEPSYGPGDILVRSHRAGVCRTDVELASGLFTDPRWVRFPSIPGHEWSGTVVALGEDVGEFETGDRVVCEGMIPCNRCRRCRAGETHLCEHYDGIGFTRGGGYGELVACPRHVVHHLPEAVSLDAASLVEPASVVYQGLLRARPLPGEGVGVVGIGTLGSLAVTLLRLFAPSEIVAYGIRGEELELARRLGADRAVHVGEIDPQATFGLDLVVETAGAPSAVELATRLVREGGRAVLLGIAGEGRLLELPADRIALRDVSLLGSVAYSSAVWAQVMDLLSSGRVEFDPIVTHRFMASDFRDAFELMERREGIVGKILLEHV